MLKIEKRLDNVYTFSVQSESGHTLLTSIPFMNRMEMQKTLSSLKTLIEQSSIFERKTDYAGKFLFVLKNVTNQYLKIEKKIT